jgi:hypothetical protein
MLFKSKISIVFVLFLSFSLKANDNTQLGITAATTLTTVLGNEASIALTEKSFNKKCIPGGEKFDVVLDETCSSCGCEVTCTGESAIETMQCNTYECSAFCSSDNEECSTCLASTEKLAKSKQRTCRNLCRTKKNTALALGLAGTSASVLSAALDQGGEEMETDSAPEDTLTCNQAKQTEEVYNRCVCEKELGGAWKDGMCYTGMGAGGNDIVDDENDYNNEEGSYVDVGVSEDFGPSDESASEDNKEANIHGAGEGSFASPDSSKKKKDKDKKDKNDLKHNPNSYKSYAGKSDSNTLGSSSSSTLKLDGKKEDKKEETNDIISKKEDIFKIVEKKYKKAYLAQRIQDNFFDAKKFRERVKGSKK